MAAKHVESRGNGVLVCLGEACLEYIAHTDGYPKREEITANLPREALPSSHKQPAPTQITATPA